MAFTGTITGIDRTIALLEGGGDAILGATFVGVQRGVLGGQSVVRGNARGRPGPRVITGDFNRSIVGDSARAGDTILGQIGTNAAQGRRLEWGFVGADRLGRVFDQPPYAYLQPSVPEVRDLLGNEVISAIGKVLG